MKRLIKFLIQSNLFIAFAALGLTIQTQVQLGMKPQWHPYLFIIFFATFFDYNLYRLVLIRFKKVKSSEDNLHWANQHEGIFYILLAVFLIGFLVAVFMAKKIVLILLMPLAVLTILYSLPIPKLKNIFFRLREIPFLKLFLIATVWSMSTVLLPVFQLEKVIDNYHVIWMFIERFLFVMAITIPFDIRDIKVDKHANIKTIPVVFGELMAMKVANFTLLLFLVVCLIHYTQQNSVAFILSFIVSSFITFFLLNNKALKLHPFYFYGWLDGSLLIQSVLVILINYIFF